jgi:hypothetical protein
MRQATSSGVADDALYARRLLEHSERLRQEMRAEKEAKVKKGTLSFKEKEKRKRNAGQQSSCAQFALCISCRCCGSCLPMCNAWIHHGAGFLLGRLFLCCKTHTSVLSVRNGHARLLDCQASIASPCI